MSLIAIDYRNLLMVTMPLMEGQIDTLKLNLEKHRSVIADQKEEIGLLRLNVEDTELKFKTEQKLRLACEKELKKKKWWQYSTYGSAAVLVGVLVFK